MSHPPVAFPPPPPTSNTLSSQERAALVRTSKKLSKVLGHVPRVFDGENPHLTPATSIADTESLWRKRKPTHIPPLLKVSPPASPVDRPDSPVTNSFSTQHRRGSVLSVAPSIISNAPSTASGSSCVSDATCEAAQRRSKLERLRRKLGNEVPATAVFPTTPRTPVPRTPKTAVATPKRSPRGRTRSITRRSAQDDTRSVTFSISSDESGHRVTLSASVRVHSPHPSRSRQKHTYQIGALPPVPPLPAHIAPSSSSSRDEDAGLVRPRQKMAAGSKIGGSDFKAARRAKREGRAPNGLSEPGEMIEMVGFLW